MTVYTEKAHALSCLISEANGNRSRENVVVASGNVIDANQVVGKITATGKYAAYDNGASDGTQTAAGIATHYVDATAGDTPLAIMARDCEVIRDELHFLTGADEAAGYVDLAAAGIVVRGPSGFGSA